MGIIRYLASSISPIVTIMSKRVHAATAESNEASGDIPEQMEFCYFCKWDINKICHSSPFTVLSGKHKMSEWKLMDEEYQA
jgi:hypothetical protein